MAGLKGEGGRTGDWEGFSSLTLIRLDLCSYRQTHSTFTYQESKTKPKQHYNIKIDEFSFNICVSLTFNWLKVHTYVHSRFGFVSTHSIKTS